MVPLLREHLLRPGHLLLLDHLAPRLGEREQQQVQELREHQQVMEELRNLHQAQELRELQQMKEEPLPSLQRREVGRKSDMSHTACVPLYQNAQRACTKGMAVPGWQTGHVKAEFTKGFSCATPASESYHPQTPLTPCFHPSMPL